MLQAAVLSFGVLTDRDQVNVVVLGLEAGDAECWAHIGKQPNRLFFFFFSLVSTCGCCYLVRENEWTDLSECEVERGVSLSDGSCEGTLKRKKKSCELSFGFSLREKEERLCSYP